jgi:hypothetical protein
MHVSHTSAAAEETPLALAARRPQDAQTPYSNLVRGGLSANGSRR